MENLFKDDVDLMIKEHLQTRGVDNPDVLEAMKRVPREEFVSPQLAPYAYKDRPLPIEEGQTISQPYIVASMAQALEIVPSDRVLDVGTGSGYAAAVFSLLAREVYSIERKVFLLAKAKHRLFMLGYKNIHLRHGDGYLGWERHAPYQAIAVAASCEEIPKALLNQMDIGARLVIPVGGQWDLQRLVRIRRVGENEYKREDLEGVQFVPLLKGLVE